MASRRYTFHLIPHTHWDREWYLTRGQFGVRLVEMIDDLVELLEREPGIPGFLLDGQTVLLEDYLRVRPEREPVIREMVSAGRIETGPWYVLADEQIPSGESLIRNLLLGRNDCDRLGRRMDVLYSPDAFGHPAILPTLAREFGIEHAAAWRGIQPDGGDLVRWRGPDGQPVLLYHLPPDGYEIGSGLSSDPAQSRVLWQTVRDILVWRSRGRDIAVMVGADHHAARQDLLALVEAIAALEPEHEVRLSRLEDFFRSVTPDRELVPIDGEQRNYGHTWVLQGVHSTRVHQKRRNSRIELWLERFAEPLSAVAALRGDRDRRALLRATWRELVQCHFHDAIAGCASDAVARAIDARFDNIEGAAREIVRRSLEDITGQDPDRARDHPHEVVPSMVLWNPVTQRRRSVVFADVTMFVRDIPVGPPGTGKPGSGPGYRAFSFETHSGETIPVQVLNVGGGLERLDAKSHYPDQDEVDVVRVAFQSPELPGLGATVLKMQPSEIPAPVAHSRKRRIENDLVAIELASNGSVTLTNKNSGRSYPGLLALQWEADHGDTYTPNIQTIADPLRPGRVKVTDVTRGPLVSMIQAEWSLSGTGDRRRVSDRRIEVRLTLMVVSDEAMVRCTFELINRASDQRLRARLPTGIAGLAAYAGGQLNAASRQPVDPSTPVSPVESVLSTAPAHRYVAAADTHGLGLFAPGFFEYELTRDGDLVLTLLRSVGQLSRNDLPTRPGHAGWPTPTPLAQCQGAHTIAFAIAPLAGRSNRDGARLHQMWENTFLPIQGVWLRNYIPGADLPDPNFTVELSGDGLVVSAIKPAEQGKGVTLRCYSLRDDPVHAAWRFGIPVGSATLCRADETPLESLSLEDNGRIAKIVVPPRGVATIVVQPADEL